MNSSVQTPTQNQTTPAKQAARIPQSAIGQLYDRLAGIYDPWGKLAESRARGRAIQLAEIQDNQTILEVAVGTGLAFYEIVKRNPHGHNLGIDLSAGMLAKAKQRLAALPQARYDLQLGTAFSLPVPDHSQDVLVNNYMFDLIPNQDMDKIILEFRRVLKPGGKLILVNMTESESFLGRIYDLAYPWFPKAIGGCRGVRMSKSLERLGFRVQIREYIQQMAFPSEVILAYLTSKK